VAGLLGHFSNVQFLPAALPYLACAAIVGGMIGSTLGSRQFSHLMLRRLLAVVLVIAGIKFMVT
jgi:uncharacterized membrane protein YfcA